MVATPLKDEPVCVGGVLAYLVCFSHSLGDEQGNNVRGKSMFYQQGRPQTSTALSPTKEMKRGR